MPTTQQQHTYPHIVERGRVLHSPYGRGTVSTVNRKTGYAGVVFDGEKTVRHVPMCRLAVEPRDMPKGLDDPMPFVRAPFRTPLPPPYRLCWSPELDRVAGEGEIA